MKNKQFNGIIFTVLASLWWGVIGVIYFKYISFAGVVKIILNDSTALNFNPYANFDDLSCIYSVSGCTNPFANNFNINATYIACVNLYSSDVPN